MRLSPGHLVYSDKFSDKNRQMCSIMEPHCLRTEQCSQALGSLKESGGLDGIVITGIHRHINKGFLESVEPSASRRICCLCSHNCGCRPFCCLCKVQRTDVMVGFRPVWLQFTYIHTYNSTWLINLGATGRAAKSHASEPLSTSSTDQAEELGVKT